MKSSPFPRAALAALLVLPSCGGGGQESAQQQELKANQTRWNAQGITRYQYTIQRNCRCAANLIGPFQVTVRDGVSTVATRAAKTRHGGHSDPNHDIASVDLIFQVVADALAASGVTTTVAYDPVRGFPTHVTIDPNAQVADDEFGYTLTEFTPLSATE